ncbi:KIR protein [Plasmodium knowlesi strain H]|uniref:PIR protein n=3 Tax=Plasmodium knowlesi TaxID=5850 RepID=A0A5E7WZQ0_PLAKH|nr:KIR protein [Plasmodium knowlesi strain H]OTN65108.1 PIR protein [Plasmodium knowlesi]CAA9988495.1 KIR protein [Plasmodium knowlesi strain H]SBO19706.1 KIR protein [Plasmodium knowlesi strain H]SBO20501.1 KIR protein [Plasmodium knowlesi strain H]VVS77969.1 KIR protein [Plasmodium knowlesi strain H]
MVKATTSTDALPSQKIYDELISKRNCPVTSDEKKCCRDVKGDDLESALRIYKYIGQDLAPKITAAWHHASNKGMDHLSFGDRCMFLYFWTGSQIKNNVFNGGTTLQTAMRDVYVQLNKFNCSNGCKLSYDDISSLNIFNWAKLLWDYYYDYKYLRIQTGGNKDSLCVKLKAKLPGARDAHSNLKGNCHSGSYCDKFKAEQSNTNLEFAAPQQLKCQGDEETITEEVIETVTSPPDLMRNKLGELPSRLLYEKFEKEGQRTCNHGSIENIRGQLETALSQYNMKEYADRILYAWCYVNQGTEDSDAWRTGRFSLFYSFVGDLLFNHAGSSDKFSLPMNQIYDALKKMHDDQPCGDMCKDVSLSKEDDTFSHVKALNEYFSDYKTLKNHLGISGNGATIKKNCEKAYYDHLSNIKKACNSIRQKCSQPGNSSDGYCMWFNANKKHYCEDEELLKLTCKKVMWTKPNPNPNQAGSSGSFSDVDLQHNGLSGGEGKGGSDGGSIVGSVSGGIATIALPTIGFLLYKYTSLFDGIKKSLFGGLSNTGGRSRGRGRRSTIGRQHFDDTFTENDYSTLGDDGSTTLGGGGGSSTLGGSSTDISTIYNESPRRPTGRTRTRTNNGRPGNIRYYAT